jgi:hypothetical protein
MMSDRWVSSNATFTLTKNNQRCIALNERNDKIGSKQVSQKMALN